jgi:hypothetical protein
MNDLAAALDTLDFLFDLEVDAQVAASRAGEAES